MINWRRPVIHGLLRLTGSDVPANLRTIRRLWGSDPETVDRFERDRLRSLVAHAYETVPYYADVLEEAGVVDGDAVDGNVEDAIHLERYDEVPILTKETIRDEGERLHSSDPGPEPYANTSGGTTGEPVELRQDQHFWAWNVATKLFYQELAGKPLGGREVKLWGSERDLRSERESLAARAKRFLYNRRTLNSYRMGEADMTTHLQEIDDFEPHTIWAYVESIHRLARFADEREPGVHSPEGIVTTAGTLEEPVRETIERVFDTRVHNQYGSREVGDVACECRAQDGLHVFSYAHHVEIVDDAGRPVGPGERGRIVVTPLHNYSMPLLRYEIGDVGVASSGSCRCGHPFPTVEHVAGRVTDHFRATNGDLVHPGYLRKTLYHREWLERFQIRQTAVDRVEFAFACRDGASPPQSELTEIERAAREVLGEDVEVAYAFPDEIAPSDSGKFRYTISEVVG